MLDLCIRCAVGASISPLDLSQDCWAGEENRVSLTTGVLTQSMPAPELLLYMRKIISLSVHYQEPSLFSPTCVKMSLAFMF